jgi:hypothetical protein
MFGSATGFRWRFVPIASMLGLLTVATLLASASPAPARRVMRVQDIAGKSPFDGLNCNVATPYYTSPGGKEGEPYIAVNPRRPSNRIAAWMDAARATVDTAYTTDGGRSWTASIPPGIDDCTGDHTRAWEASGDPWISFGPDGVAYLSTLTWAHFATPPFTDYTSVVHVQTSSNGGRTWSSPVVVGAADAVSDKPMVAADPYHAGVAYEIWRNQSFGLPVGARGATRLYFAFTSDGGATWSAPITIAAGAPSDFFGNPQLSVLRSGTLVATSSLTDSAGGTDQLSWRSIDGGLDWDGPGTIRNAPDGIVAPICGQGAAGGDTGAASGQQAVVDGRSVVLVTNDGPTAAAGAGELLLSRSDNGGRTWHTAPLVRSDQPILLASIAANSRGLGVVWDEVNLQAVDCSGPTIPARSMFAFLDGGRSRGRRAMTIGASWWNLAAGLRGTGGFSGYFLGDYQALATAPGGFTTVTVQGEPLVPGAPPINGDNGVIVASVVGQGGRWHRSVHCAAAVARATPRAAPHALRGTQRRRPVDRCRRQERREGRRHRPDRRSGAR